MYKRDRISELLLLFLQLRTPQASPHSFLPTSSSLPALANAQAQGHYSPTGSYFISTRRSAMRGRTVV